MNERDIYPEFARMLTRADKEKLLQQRGRVVWLYGLSGSGKSTLANALERGLHAKGVFTQILDGDNMRMGLNKDLGFSSEDRLENIRRIAEVAKLLVNAGIFTVAAFITPTRELRALARHIIGAADFLEVYVRASFEICAERDVKGLYAKAQAGGVAQFTGRDSAFEEPEPSDNAFIIDTTTHDLPSALALLEAKIS